MRHLAAAFRINGTAGSSLSSSRVKPYKVPGKSPNPLQNMCGGSDWGFVLHKNPCLATKSLHDHLISKHSETQQQGRMVLLPWPKLLASQEGFHLLSQQVFQVFHQLSCL